MYITNFFVSGYELVITGRVDNPLEINPIFKSSIRSVPLIVELSPYMKVQENDFEIRITKSVFKNIQINQDMNFWLFKSMCAENAIQVDNSVKNQKILWEGECNFYVFEINYEKETIVVKVKKRKQRFGVKQIWITSDYKGIGIDLDVVGNICHDQQIYVCIKKRMTERLWQYSDLEIELKMERDKEGQLIFDFPYNKMIKNYIESQFYDFYLKIKEKNYEAEYFLYPLWEGKKGEVIQNIQFQREGDECKVKIYISNGGNLSLFFEKEKMIQYVASSINISDLVNINFEMEEDCNLEQNEMYIVFKKRIYNDSKLYCDTYKSLLERKDNKLFFRKNTEEFLLGYVKKDKEMWDFFIEKNGELYPVVADKTLKTPYFIAAGDFQLCFFIRNDTWGGVSIYTHEGLHEKLYKIKIAVLGTCFTRSVFKSDPYFNPDYKRFYECCYTQFHSSVISMASGKVEMKYEEYVKGVEAKKYLPTEFNKDFIEQFIKSRAEYLLLDNYIEVMKPVIEVDEDCYLTYNKYYNESDLARMVSGYRMIFPGTEEYYQLYKKYVSIFLEEVKKYIPEDHIILVQGRFSCKWIDERTNQIEEWNGIPTIKRNNNIWDKTDYIFRTIAPKARVIDMRETPFLSDVHSPIPGGASPSHYQRGYYREILNQLNKIVMQDKFMELGK